jgi:hypothetical protein
VRFTDERCYFVSEATVYRLLKAHDLIASPAYVVVKAADAFHSKTTRPNEMWQTASLAHARAVLRRWRDDYNHVRPHSGIGGLTPADAARRVVQPRPQGHHDNPGLYL